MSFNRSVSLLCTGLLTVMIGSRFGRPWNFVFGALGVAEVVVAVWRLQRSQRAVAATPTDHNDAAS